MDADLVNPFIEATINTLATTASVSVRMQRPFHKAEGPALGDVTGVLRLSGDSSGSVTISFSESCILAVVSTMFGEAMTELNDEIRDAVGEIANMVAGQVTTKLGEGGKTVKVEMKDVVMGRPHRVTHEVTGPVVAIPFETPDGPFTIEVCLSA